MIIIKQKKLVLFGLVFIGLFICLPSVVAYPTFAIGEVYDFVTVWGTHLDGDVDSFHLPDGDVIYWRGNWMDTGAVIPTPWPWPDIPIYAWHFMADAFFDRPGPSYSNVWLEIKFNFVGAYPLYITVYYDEGGTDTFYVDPTGGYVNRIYNLDDYKHVYAVVFKNINIFSRPYLYIDYLCIGYETM